MQSIQLACMFSLNNFNKGTESDYGKVCWMSMMSVRYCQFRQAGIFSTNGYTRNLENFSTGCSQQMVSIHNMSAIKHKVSYVISYIRQMGDWYLANLLSPRKYSINLSYISNSRYFYTTLPSLKGIQPKGNLMD